MKLSIVIPAHNEERVIGRTLATIRMQGAAVHEAIVVCNGCRDRTAARARQDGARVVVTDRCGVSLARNLGARHASGDTLLFVDADVLLAPGLVSAVAAAVGRWRQRGRHRARGARQPPLPASLWCGSVADPGAPTVVERPHLLLGAAVPCQWAGSRRAFRSGEDNLFMRRARRLPGVRYRYLSHPPAVSDTRRLRRWGSLRLLFIWLRSAVARDKKAVDYAAVR